MDTGRLQQLFHVPRMGHVPEDDVKVLSTCFHINNVKGLYEMVKKYVNSETEMVEVGSFQGVSTILFSMFAKKVYSVDCYDYVVPATGRIPEHDQLFVDAEKIFIERTKDIPNIIKVKKPSIEAANDFPNESLDLVYIDAEHDYKSVLDDVKAWTPKIKKGGILSGHDWWLEHIELIIRRENLANELNIYSDSSWSVVIR